MVEEFWDKTKEICDDHGFTLTFDTDKPALFAVRDDGLVCANDVVIYTRVQGDALSFSLDGCNYVPKAELKEMSVYDAIRDGYLNFSVTCMPIQSADLTTDKDVLLTKKVKTCVANLFNYWDSTKLVDVPQVGEIPNT